MMSRVNVLASSSLVSTQQTSLLKHAKRCKRGPLHSIASVAQCHPTLRLFFFAACQTSDHAHCRIARRVKDSAGKDDRRYMRDVDDLVRVAAWAPGIRSGGSARRSEEVESDAAAARRCVLHLRVDGQGASALDPSIVSIDRAADSEGGRPSEARDVRICCADSAQGAGAASAETARAVMRGRLARKRRVRS